MISVKALLGTFNNNFCEISLPALLWWQCCDWCEGRRWWDEDYIPEECHRDRGDTQRWRDMRTHCFNLYLYTYLGYLDVHHIFSMKYACSRHFYSYFDIYFCRIIMLRSINRKSSRSTTIKTHSCHKLQPTVKASPKYKVHMVN